MENQNSIEYLDIGAQINNSMIRVLNNHTDTKRIIDLALLEIQPKYRENLNLYFVNPSNRYIPKDMSFEEYHYLIKKVKAYITIILNYCFIITPFNKAEPFMDSFKIFLSPKYGEIFKNHFTIGEDIISQITANNLLYAINVIASELDIFLSKVQLIIPKSLISQDLNKNYYLTPYELIALSQNNNIKKLINLAINTNLPSYREMLKLALGLQNGIVHSKEELSDFYGLKTNFISFLLDETCYECNRILQKYLNNEPQLLKYLLNIKNKPINPKNIDNFLHMLNSADLKLPLVITIPNHKVAIDAQEYRKLPLESSINYLIKEFITHESTRILLENILASEFISNQEILKYAFGLIDGKTHGYKSLYNKFKGLSYEYFQELLKKNKTILFHKISSLQVKTPDGEKLQFFDAFMKFLSAQDREIFSHVYFINNYNKDNIYFNKKLANQKDRIMTKKLGQFIEAVEFIMPIKPNSKLADKLNYNNCQSDKKECILSQEILTALNNGLLSDFNGNFDDKTELILYLKSKNISTLSIAKFLQVSINQLENITENKNYVMTPKISG